MTYSQISPNVIKGSLLAINYNGELQRSIVFQFNPESIQRSIVSQGGDTGPRKSSISFRQRVEFVIEADAYVQDAVGASGSNSTTSGILPFLSGLELLIDPPQNALQVTSHQSATDRSGRIGQLLKRVAVILRSVFGLDKENGNDARVYLLLQLGEQRVMPVKPVAMEIIEQAFDHKLQPVRASVRLVLDTLSRDECSHSGYLIKLYDAQLQRKIAFARQYRSGQS